MNQIYDKDVMENEGSHKNGKVYTNVATIEGVYKISTRHTIRLNLQWLGSTQDSAYTDINADRKNGDWAQALLEYSVAPHWFVSVYDEYNYSNPTKDYELHYPAIQLTYSLKSTQIALAYGKQRGGLLCVGGVCRPVPASDGFRFNVTTSF